MKQNLIGQTRTTKGKKTLTVSALTLFCVCFLLHMKDVTFKRSTFVNHKASCNADCKCRNCPQNEIGCDLQGQSNIYVNKKQARCCIQATHSAYKNANIKCAQCRDENNFHTSLLCALIHPIHSPLPPSLSAEATTSKYSRRVSGQ